MHEITSEQLAEMIDRFQVSSDNELDLLLTELLIRPYPTKVTQDN
ncbi:MAG TPA: hypothetical protein VNT03_09655 [Baekduia sp.]|nr:hypothetical protein [Baekduia sp.]